MPRAPIIPEPPKFRWRAARAERRMRREAARARRRFATMMNGGGRARAAGMCRAWTPACRSFHAGMVFAE